MSEDPVIYGLQRKGTQGIIGVIPVKIHQNQSPSPSFKNEYEEIPLYTEDVIQKLQDEINRLKNDAARYKWLKDRCVFYSEATDSFELRLRYGGVFNEDLNSAIDHRMSQ